MLLTKAYIRDPRVAKEATSLVSAGNEVTVLEWSRHENNPLPVEIIDGVKIVRLKNTKLMNIMRSALFQNPLWWSIATKKALELHAENPFDIIHAHDLDTLSIGVRFKKSTGAKLIYDAHEIFSYMISDDYRFILPRIAQSLEDRWIKNIDGLIVAGENYIPFYSDRTDAPVAQVLNCPKKPNDDYSIKRSKPFTVSYIGVLHKVRLFPDAVHALGNLEGIRFEIAAKKEGCYNAVEAASSKYDNVDFLGPIPYHEVMARTSKADAILCMFNPESLLHKVCSPNKLYDSMAAGIPGIFSNKTHCGSFATDNEVGISVDFSPDILRETVTSLKEDSSLCEKLGRNGHKLANETYNWEKQAENLIDLYHSIS